MSALHWEARRRQSALERRAAQKHQLLQGEDASGSLGPLSPTSPPGALSPTSPLGSSEPAPSVEPRDGSHSERPRASKKRTVDQCPQCKSAVKSSNRYSSLQYKQQW